MNFGDLIGGGFGGGFRPGLGGFGGGSNEFVEQYHCFSMAVIGRAHLETGDKMLLPPSALDTLARLNVDWPMLFQVTNDGTGKSTHCGVLEFSAEEGKCHLPYWVMQNLLSEEGSMLTIKNVSLPKATFVKFQPQHVDFLDISDPRAVLEYTLRSYSCLTLGDHICVPYNDRKYYLEVKELQPADAASIIETDCNVDFEAPVGYKEPERVPADASAGIGGGVLPIPAPQSARLTPDESEDGGESFQAFEGGGQRLDGKATPASAPAAQASPQPPAAPSQQADAGPAGTTEAQPAKPRYMGRGGSRGPSKYASRKPTAQAFAGTGRSLGK